MSVAVRNVFAGNPLDRTAGWRTDGRRLADAARRPGAKIYAICGGAVLVEAEPTVLTCVDRRVGEDGKPLLFLGCDGDGAPHFAVDLETVPEPSAAPWKGRAEFRGLRDVAVVLPADEAAIAATALAVFEWSRRTRFCPRCGAPLIVADGGWRRTCTACGHDQFPRTDPVVIMLPVRGEQCLLGRQASWAPGRYSALAGFMEPGESIEEACARELAEEAALSAAAVRYHSSQPWPFPTNLMIGLIAEVEGGEARAADGELEAVRWVARDELRAVLARPDGDPPRSGAGVMDRPPAVADLSVPPPLAIARRLMESWAVDPVAPGRTGTTRSG